MFVKSESLDECCKALIQFLLVFESFRYKLPSRWRDWGTLYNEVAKLYVNEGSGLFGASSNPGGKKKVSKQQKLQLRAKNVNQYETGVIKEMIGIKLDKDAKLKKDEKIQWIVPKEKIDLRREIRKTVPFCIDGTVEILSLLYTNILSSEDRLPWL